jgi:hypothetical protein
VTEDFGRKTVALVQGGSRWCFHAAIMPHLLVSIQAS